VNPGAAGEAGAPPERTLRYAGPGGGEPPDPCVGVDYSATFYVDDEATDDSWRAVELPSGLSFDVDTHVLSGVLSAAATVTLEVSDGVRARGRRTFSLSPRKSCWLAYLSARDGPTELELVDPVLGTRRSFSEHTADEVTTDFKFAADGQLLAYRLQAADGSYRLSVRAAPRWQEIELNLQGSVEQYAWAPEADVLAVALAGDDGSALAGARFVPRESSPADGASPAVDVIVTPPVRAAVESEFVWFGADFLSFAGPHQSNLSAYRIPYVASFRADEFSTPAPIELSAYTPALVLQGGPAGLFVSDPTAPVLEYYGYAAGSAASEEPAYARFYDAVRDPGGNYAAAVGEGMFRDPTLGKQKLGRERLGLFDLESGILDDKVAVASADGCSMLLAWASGRERLACVDDASGELRIFSLNAGNAALARTTVTGSYDYGHAAALTQRRSFSPSGNWFAFTTESHLYVADLRFGAPWLTRSDGLLLLEADDPERNLVDLSFSPDEKFLLEHRGSQLSLHALYPNETQPSFVLQGLEAGLPKPAACNDQFVSAPRDWCGSGSSSPAFAWSPGSDFVAFATTSGKLVVKDLRQLFDSVPSPFEDSYCGVVCRFAFQP
jgi:hypothetical protein